MFGSSNPVCDTSTGQCLCHPNVALQGQQNSFDLDGDLRCSACRKDYYGMSSGEGCQFCDCDMEVSGKTYHVGRLTGVERISDLLNILSMGSWYLCCVYLFFVVTT